MQYIISRNNIKNTLRIPSGCFCRKLPIYKNKISLDWKKACSLTRVFTVFQVYFRLYIQYMFSVDLGLRGKFELQFVQAKKDLSLDNHE